MIGLCTLVNGPYFILSSACIDHPRIKTSRGQKSQRHQQTGNCFPTTPVTGAQEIRSWPGNHERVRERERERERKREREKEREKNREMSLSCSNLSVWPRKEVYGMIAQLPKMIDSSMSWEEIAVPLKRGFDWTKYFSLKTWSSLLELGYGIPPP